MFRLPTIAMEDATGSVQNIYDEIASIDGEPHLLFQCFANDPDILRVQWNLEKELMHGDSVMPKRLREYVSLTVAMLSGCGG